MDKCQRIRSLFLAPANSYALREVASLTGTSLRTLRREVTGGYHDAVKVGGAWRFTWRQAIYVALERWNIVEISDALGDDAAVVLPPLLAPCTVTVRLPEYMVRALEAVAAEDGTTLDCALFGELMDFAGARSGEMEAVIPGYRLAYFFPAQP